MEALCLARAEEAEVTAEARVTRTLISKLPTSIRFKLIAGRNVREYDEASKNWLPGYTIGRTDGKQVGVNSGTCVI